MRSEPINNRPSRIAEPQQLSNLIESFASSIVASVADILIAPTIPLLFGEIQMSVSARDDQREHRKLQIVISALLPFKKHSVNVALEMIYSDERLLQSKGQRFGKTDPDQKGS